MSRNAIVHSLALILLATSQSLSQEASRSFPLLKDLEVFTGTFQGKAVLPTGTADSEKLGEMQNKKVTIIQTTRWAPGKCAQIVDVSYALDKSETILATMIIGWDQTKKKITTRSYTTHKGVWAGTVAKDGNKWVFAHEGYNLDGKKVRGQRTVTFNSADEYTEVETLTRDGKPEPSITWHFKRL